MLIMVTRQAGNACMASLIFIESFHGGVNKAKVRHHCFTRPVSITGTKAADGGTDVAKETGVDESAPVKVAEAGGLY